MTVKVTVQEISDAFVAFGGVKNRQTGEVEGGIGNAVLPPKAAYRVARLISKLKAELLDFEEAKRKLFLDAGGVNEAGGISLKFKERGDDESQSEFDGREKKHAATVNVLNEQINELLKETVEIDYDPIPLSLFENERAPEKSAQLRPVDLANAGPFIKE